MAKKKRHIFIHPDHVENLDRKWERLELNKQEAKPTGYVGYCRFRSTPEARYSFMRHIDVLFHRKFVESKLPTRAFFFYHDTKRDWYMLQPAKPEWINRTHINHVLLRPFSKLRRFGYAAPLTTTPPCQIFYNTCVSPLARAYTYQLQEYYVNDEHEGRTLAYRLVPVSRLF